MEFLSPNKSFKRLACIVLAVLLTACPDNDKKPAPLTMEAACKPPTLNKKLTPENSYIAMYADGKRRQTVDTPLHELTLASYTDMDFKFPRRINFNPKFPPHKKYVIYSATGDIKLFDTFALATRFKHNTKPGQIPAKATSIYVLAPEGSIYISGKITADSGSAGGSFGGHGGDVILCARDKIIVGGSGYVLGGDGADGSTINRTAVTEKRFTSIGLSGGDGGNVHFFVSSEIGEITINSIVTGGKGGNGSTVVLEGDVGNRALSARGGTGGNGGTVTFSKPPKIAKADYLKAGKGGNGGDARVIAGDGKDSDTPVTGANAKAEGGSGGNAGVTPKGGVANYHGDGGRAAATAGDGGRAISNSDRAMSGNSEIIEGRPGGWKKHVKKTSNAPGQSNGSSIIISLPAPAGELADNP